jgi:hypothetical protein
MWQLSRSSSQTTHRSLYILDDSINPKVFAANSNRAELVQTAPFVCSNPKASRETHLAELFRRYVVQAMAIDSSLAVLDLTKIYDIVT